MQQQSAATRPNQVVAVRHRARRLSAPTTHIDLLACPWHACGRGERLTLQYQHAQAGHFGGTSLREMHKNSEKHCDRSRRLTVIFRTLMQVSDPLAQDPAYRPTTEAGRGPGGHPRPLSGWVTRRASDNAARPRLRSRVGPPRSRCRDIRRWAEPIGTICDPNAVSRDPWRTCITRRPLDRTCPDLKLAAIERRNTSGRRTVDA